MFATRLLLCALTCVQAQVVVEKVAGVDRRSGDLAWELGIHSAGTAWDAQGNAYVAAFHRIWKIHPDGIAEVYAGTGEGGAQGSSDDIFSGDGGPAIQARFSLPDTPRRDAAGNIYFFADQRLLRIGTDGRLTTVAGTGLFLNGGMATEGPAKQVAVNFGKFAIDPAGVIYMMDQWLVRRLDLAGNITVIAAAEVCPYPCGGPTQHIYPPNTPKVHLIVDLDVDPKTGDVYISEETDFEKIVVHKVSPGGVLVPFREISDAGGDFFDLAVDKDGNFFVARYVPGGVSIQKLGGGPAFPAPLPPGYFKSVLWLNPDGKLVYVNGTTVRFAEDGSVMRQYPDGALVPSPDGTSALETRIIGGTAIPIAVSRAGEIFFVEQRTCRLRKFDREKLLRTVFRIEGCGDMSGIAMGPDDRIWVTGNRRAWLTSPDGNFSEIALPSQLWGGQFVSDAKGRLYTIGPDGVARMGPDGSVQVVRTAGEGLGNDALGNVYISDAQGVYRVEDSGIIAPFLSGDYSGGKFVIDAQRRVWRRFEVPAAFPVGDPAIASNGDIFTIVNPYPWSDDQLLQIYKRSEAAPRAKPLISRAGVVNGASYAGNAVAPGELVTVFGENFGMTALQLSQVVNNRLPTRLGPVKVTFNDIEGAITAATAKQINVFVPSTIPAASEVKIKVFVDEAASEEITLPVVDTMFGLSTLDASGRGQGAILNANGTVNSRANPAQRGSLVVLFGTGEGKVFPDAGIGAVNVAAPYPKAMKSLTVRIGGQPAEMTFQGGAPTLAQGVYQINARIPLSVAPGDVAVEVVAEGGATSKPVTVAVQ